MPPDLLAFAFHRRGEQRALVAELVVDGDFGDARIGSDLFDRGGSVTVMEEVLRGGFQDRRPLADVERPTSLATHRLFCRGR